MGIKSKPLSLCEKLNIINRVGVILNVPRAKITEELGTGVRKVVDSIGQIPAGLIKVGGRTICFEIHKLIPSV
jgi:hypothetical protein